MKTKKHSIKNFLELLAAILLLVGLDQYTKFLAVKHLKDQAEIALIPNVLYFQYLENRGAAFGIFQGRQGFFFLIGIVVLAVAGYAMLRMPGWQEKRYHWLKLCVIMITAGAVGNMIDRVSQ